MTPRAETQSAALDALAVLLASERGDARSIDLMFASYAAGTSEYAAFIGAIVSVATVAVRVAACTAGITPETLLAGTAATIRGDTTSEV